METNTVAISGNTYPVRDALRGLGGRWNPDKKAWMVPAAKADQARSLVGGSAHTHSDRPRKCRVCGESERKNSRGYYEVRIYRSGECQDCFEERKMGY